jgi:hypothetical protein
MGQVLGSMDGFVAASRSACSHAGDTRRQRFRGRRDFFAGSLGSASVAVKMTRLSCHHFRANEVRLWVRVIADNLGNLVAATGTAGADRQVIADQPAAQWLVKTGGRLIKHFRYLASLS